MAEGKKPTVGYPKGAPANRNEMQIAFHTPPFKTRQREQLICCGQSPAIRVAIQLARMNGQTGRAAIQVARLRGHVGGRTDQTLHLPEVLNRVLGLLRGLRGQRTGLQCKGCVCVGNRAACAAQPAE